MLRLITFFTLIAIAELGYAQAYLIQQHADSGNLEAQLYVAQKYFNGEDDFPKNLTLSFKYYNMAALQGNPEAMWKVATMYGEGLGVESDSKKAYYWVEKSSKAGYPPAILYWGLVNYKNKEYETACGLLLNHYRNYGEKSHPYVLQVLGELYYNGLGVEKDLDKAISFLTESLKYKSESILEPGRIEYTLGRIFYEQGDFVQAKSYHKSALKYDLSDNLRSDCLLSLGEIYLQEGKNDDAQVLWGELLRVNPDVIHSDSEFAVAMGGSIDFLIPECEEINSSYYAIVIANENYKRVPIVPYAINDGQVFKKYLKIALGIPEENIEYLEDASLNDIKYSINSIEQHCSTAKGKNTVIVYYAGHGVPDGKSGEAFILPVDGIGSDPSLGLSLDSFYNSLAKMPAKSIVVLLDACFSGTKRDGSMLMATRGVTIKPKMRVPDGKMIVFSATSKDETAFPIETHHHGLFTYTILRKIQETKGNITWGELSDYVTETVMESSIGLNGKLQTPSVAVSPSIRESWRSINIRKVSK